MRHHRGQSCVPLFWFVATSQEMVELLQKRHAGHLRIVQYCWRWFFSSASKLTLAMSSSHIFLNIQSLHTSSAPTLITSLLQIRPNSLMTLILSFVCFVSSHTNSLYLSQKCRVRKFQEWAPHQATLSQMCHEHEHEFNQPQQQQCKWLCAAQQLWLLNS